MGIGRLSAAALIALAACGDGVNDPAPRLIEGGGVGDGTIEGVLHVHVIDGADDEPIAGATVSIGEPGSAPIEGTTDSTGLFSHRADDLSGPQTITVTAAGRVPSTLFGANG